MSPFLIVLVDGSTERGSLPCVRAPDLIDQTRHQEQGWAFGASPDRAHLGRLPPRSWGRTQASAARSPGRTASPFCGRPCGTIGRRSAETVVLKGARHAVRSPRVHEHGRRLRAVRALTARRVRGDPPRSPGRGGGVCGRAGSPRGRSRGRRRGELPRPDPRSHTGARRPTADLCAGRSADEPVERCHRPPSARVRWSCRRGRSRRHSCVGRRRLRGRRCRHGRVLRHAGGARRGMPAGARAQPAAHHGDQPGGHPPAAGALPAVGQRARCGHRHGDALGRGRNRARLDRLRLSRLPGPHRRGRTSELGASPRRISGNGCWSCAQRSSRRVADSSRRFRPPPLRVPTGRGCTWRSSAT